MFSPRKRPLLLVPKRILSLRLSLNTPILATSELTAGPARAAIAVHSEAGEPRFTVAVRSLRNGVSVVYELEGEDLNDARGHAVAVDAALSFGESMGFLFDDELVTDRRAETLRRAVARLREIVAPPGASEEAAEELAADESEILLEDPVELEPDAEPAGSEEPGDFAAAQRVAAREGAAPPAPEPPQEALPLTKFRSAASALAPVPSPPAPATGRGRAARARLGRVRPVRMRAGGDGPPPVPPLLRLLSAF